MEHGRQGRRPLRVGRREEGNVTHGVSRMEQACPPVGCSVALSTRRAVGLVTSLSHKHSQCSPHGLHSPSCRVVDCFLPTPSFIMSQFDAEALERAAKFARELEKSRNVKAIMELSKREQKLKMAEEDKKKAEFEKEKAAYAVQAERARWEEQRKTMQQKKQEQMVRARNWACST